MRLFFSHSAFKRFPRLVFSLFILIHTQGVSQNLTQQLRLAKEYENASRWKEARQMYETMHSEYPDNVLVFEALKNLYLRTFAFQEAKSLIEHEIERQPKKIHLRVDLARVFYRMGDEKEAMHQFENILSQHRKNINTYHLVANALSDERLYNRAIEVLITGRKNQKKPSLYALSLAQLYATQLDFKKASEELLLYLKNNPKRLNYVQSQYLRFPKSQTVLEQLTRPIQEEIKKTPDHLDYYRLLAKIYEHHEAYEKAFDILQRLESKSSVKNQGRMLFQFAEAVFFKGSVKEAERAYKKILTSYPHFVNTNKVLFGLAKCHEAGGDTQDAVNAYQKIIHAFPEQSFSSQAAFRMGMLQRDRLFDLNAAEQTFMWIISQFQDSPDSRAAELELAEIHMMQRDTSATLPLLIKNIHRHLASRPGHHLQAMYLLARLYYFQKEYSQSIAWLDSLASSKWKSDSFQDPVVNDGLQLRFFIQLYYKSFPKQLRILSEADYLSYQRKYRKAIEEINKLLQEEKKETIHGDALFKKGSLLMRIDQPKNALNAFQQLLTLFPDHFLADQALERCGYLYEKLNKKNQALIQYEKLLTDYPHSLFADEIRNRIRNLEQE